MPPVIVVESTGKQRILSDLVRKAALVGWVVVSCSGHYCGLPKNQLGLDSKTLAFTWKVRNMQAFERVKKAVADADVVYAITDFSPEGESIANQISITAGYAKKPFHRLRLTALDVDSLLSAIQSPSDIDQKVLQGYLAREAADRIVQFVLSPVLAARMGEGLELNRTAVPLLSELARVERKIRRFQPETYSVVRALLSDGSTAESRPLTAEQAEETVRRSKAAVPAFERVKELMPVEPPFTLSSLIQFSSKRYGIDALSCMRACDTLYAMGLITYPYTDSCGLSIAVAQCLHTYVSEKLSKDLAADRPTVFPGSSSLEAIRPVQISLTPSQLDLSGDLRSIYSAIWFLAVGSQGKYAQLERQSCIYFLDEQEAFKADGLSCLAPGWYQLSGRLFEPVIRYLESDATVVDASAIEITSRPPKRHTHGTLVAWLDAHCLGRPWVYRSALESLQANSYVEMLGGGMLKISPKGEAVLTFVRLVTSDLLDHNFCFAIEKEISSVEQGQLTIEQFCRDRLKWANDAVSRMTGRSLRPRFVSPNGQKLRVYIDKETQRPYARTSDEEWWSYVVFDENGHIIPSKEV